MEVKCQRLEGKVAVVTASTQGIGLAIAERLGLEGAAVVISSRKQVRPSLPAVVTSSCLDSSASFLIRFLFLGPDLLQKNVDEAVEGLKAKGITAVGAVCHVSDAQQRKHLIDTSVKVRTGFSFFQAGYVVRCVFWHLCRGTELTCGSVPWKLDFISVKLGLD
jgi:dehydrogenase/reductase SDR family member 4